ncbi:hypothetical protein ABRS97_27805, partial [Paenibacillus sp. SI92]
RYSTGTGLNGKGENVKFDLNFFDQYGGTMSYETLQSQDKLKDTSVIWNDYIDSKDVSTVFEDNGNDIPQLKISLINDLDKAGDFGFTVFNQAATATGKVSIKSAKVANKIEIGDMNDVIAAGDKDIYIPVVAYDAQGNKLSVEDLTSEQNVKRISVSLSGAVGDGDATTVSIEDSGEHKGSIKLHEVKSNAKGAVSVTAVIATANASSTATKTYTVADARVPDHFKEVKAPAKSAVPGGESKFEFDVIDQYGKVLDDSLNVNATTGYVDAAGSHYTVEASAVTYSASATTDKYVNTNAKIIAPGTVGEVPASNPTTYNPLVFDNTGTTDFGTFNDEFKFVVSPNAKDEKVEFTAKIIKTTPGVTNPTEIAKVTRTLNVAQSTEDLTYAVDAVGNLFNTLDSGIVSDADQKYATAADKVITKEDQTSAAKSLMAKEITITAKNAAGDSVELPGQITQVTSSNQSVAKVQLGTGADAGKAFVIGNKAGTATLNVSFKTIKGEVKQATVAVTVKADAIDVSQITAEDSATINNGDRPFVAADIKVTDNYGITYEKEEVAQYNHILGLTFSASHVKNGTVEINQYGEITATPSGTANVTFDLTTTAANGKSVVTAITVVPAT